VTASNPVRYPDVRSRPLMTKRAWYLVVLGILIPGSAQVLAGNRRAGRFGLATTLLFWALVLIAVVAVLVSRSTVVGVVTTPAVLWVLGALAVFYGILWFALGVNTLRLARLVKASSPAKAFIAALSVIALVGTTSVAAYAVVNIAATIGVVHEVFSDGEIAAPIDGRYNIMLLGGDAGPDRVGLRPDSISVVSIDADTGAIVMFGIPRNLEQAPFSDGSPMYGPYPDGYNCGDDCLVSYLYTYGQEHPDLYPKAEKAGSSPGIEAMRDAVQGVLGMQIQYYVLIDMKGFADLVDALGGIDVTVKDRLPIGSNTDKFGNPVPPIGYIEAGKQHLNGRNALWYARSRYGTTDYDRMRRQREVQEAIFQQADPANVITRFQAVAAAGSKVVSTDIPQTMLGHFADLAEKSKKHKLTKVEFVPPNWDVVHPDFGLIHKEVDAETKPKTKS
jgi:LCP family protein required for cell wall assembly